MALDAYIEQTRSLLQPGTASNSLYSDADLTRWINLARKQLAVEPQNSCIRAFGAISTVFTVNAYNFSSINFGASVTNGIAGAINIRSLSYSVGTGRLWLTPRTWPWMTLYEFNNAVSAFGPPESWAAFAQGVAGSFYLSPIPDLVYALFCDAVCYPIDLEDDATVEAIPYPWTDCVPFFAAYWALMSAQTNARMNDAIGYYKMYKEFADRARAAANPETNRWMYQQAGDPAQGPKMGISKGAA